MPRLTDGAEAVQEAEHRLVGRLGVGAQRVCAPDVGVLGCMPGEGGADAAELMVIGNLERKVEHTRLPADGTGADEGDRLVVGAESEPALGVGQQADEGAVRQVPTAPATQQICQTTALVEGVDERGSPPP